jgi:tetratricopeptide (TPR) repeat protein
MNQVKMKPTVLSADLSTATPPVGVGLVGVPPLPDLFIGREEILSTLVERIGTTDQAIASSDVSGSGKTTLAIEVARHPRILAEFSDGIIWASLNGHGGAEGLADALDVLSQWAATLGIDIAGDADAYTVARAVHDSIGSRRMLLVLDDAWDRDTAYLLRCGGPNCRHLLITRDEPLARAFAGEKQAHTLPPLSPQDCLALLKALAPVACDTDPQAIDELIAAMSGLPLAVTLLGGYLGATDYSPAEAPTRDSVEPGALERRRLAFARQRLGKHTHAQTALQQMIALSMAVLQEPALRALRVLGAFAPSPATFTRQAALAVTGADDTALNCLIARRLVNHNDPRTRQNNTDPSSEFLTVHPGVSGVARARTDGQAAAHHRAFYLAQAVMAREHGLPIEHSYAQIKHAWQSAPDEPALIEFGWALQPFQERNHLVFDQAVLAHRCQSIIATSTARQSTVAAVELPDQLEHILSLKSGPTVLADVLHQIGLAYASSGRDDRAISFFNRALPLHEQASDTVATAQTLRHIGHAYERMGKYELAQEFLQRALPTFEGVTKEPSAKEHTLSGQQPTIAPSAVLGDIGAIYNALGRHDQALNILQRDLEVHQTAPRNNPALLAELLYQLAYACDRMGKTDKALEYYQRALDLYEVLGTRSDTQRATILIRIGALYARKGEHDKALTHYNLSLGLADRAASADALVLLADSMLILNQPEQALTYAQRALPIFEESDTQRGWTGAAESYRIVGHAQRKLGQRDQALEAFQRAKALYEKSGAGGKVLIEQSIGLADVLLQIGEILRNVLQLSKALDMLLEAMNLLEAWLKSKLSPDNKGEVLHTRVIAQIGAVYTSLGNADSAMQFLSRALPLQEQSGDHAGEAETRYHLALLHQSQGRLDKAVSNLQRVVELDQKLTSPEGTEHQALLAQIQAEVAKAAQSEQKPRGLKALFSRGRK